MDIEDKGSVIANLVNKCYKNDQRAQLLLYEMFSSAMFNVSFRITGDKFQAEDIMQESFLTVFEKIRECRNPNHFGSWLKRIVVNRSIDEVRKKKIRILPLDETLQVAADVEDFFGEVEIEQAKLLENIKKGISLLPDGYRIVLVLKLIENYEYADISKVLGLAESSVRSQYVRAKQKLLEIIRNFKNTENE